MKALYRISIFCNVIAMAFIIIRGSELLTREWVQQNAAESEILPEADAQQQPQAAVDMQMRGAEDTHKKTAEHVSSDTGETTTCDTIYHVLICDASRSMQQEEIAELPIAYIGKNREQLAELLAIYNESPPMEELEKGFQSAELIAFSKTDITVRKFYESKDFYCCVVVEDGYLVVYDEHRKDVILYTDIQLDDLPQELVQEIIDGKYFRSQQQLYHFLESYSS